MKGFNGRGVFGAGFRARTIFDDDVDDGSSGRLPVDHGTMMLERKERPCRSFKEEERGYE